MNLEQMKNLSREYDEENQRKQENLTARFKALVDKHGVSIIAAATGLAESSVLVYSRGTKPSGVSEYVVVKAETILNNL